MKRERTSKLNRRKHRLLRPSLSQFGYTLGPPQHQRRIRPMPTLNEVPEVAKLLATILTGEPVTHGALAVIPLLAPNLDVPDWLTLEEAGDRARVTEVSEAGSVPFLQVANGADRPLLLLDGEELIGAKQNRILNTTVLVAARTETTIPVSCVEQGRWGYRGRHFAPGDASLFASTRQKKAAW